MNPRPAFRGYAGRHGRAESLQAFPLNRKLISIREQQHSYLSLHVKDYDCRKCLLLSPPRFPSCLITASAAPGLPLPLPRDAPGGPVVPSAP